MNICFVTRRFFPTISGMSTYAYNLVKQYIALGHQVTVFAQYREIQNGVVNHYRHDKPIKISGAEIIGVPQTWEDASGNFEKDIQFLVKKIIELNEKAHFDVLHAQYAYPPGLAVIEASRILKIPSVISIQGGDGHWLGTCCNYHKRVVRHILSYSDAILVPTNSFADEISRNSEMRADYIRLPGAVDTNLFYPLTPDDRSNIRGQYGIPLNALVISYHGRIDWRKGIGDLLSAFDILKTNNRNSDIVLVISGVGPNEEMLVSEIEKHNFSKDIYYLGFIPYEDSCSILNIGDIFCTPTYGEGFSNTIVEALACGLPLVSTNVVGVSDVIENRCTGLLVKVKDPKDLARGLQELIEDQSLRKKLSMEGRRLVMENYSWIKLAENILSVYKNIQAFDHKVITKWDLLDSSHWGLCQFREKPFLL